MDELQANVTITVAIVTAASGLVGALVGGVAALVGPLLLEGRRARAAAKLARSDARAAALREFVAALLEGAAHPGEVWPDELAPLATRINNAHLAFRMLFNESEQHAATYLDSLMIAVQITPDVPSRMEMVNNAGLALSDWLRGVRPMTDLRWFNGAKPYDHPSAWGLKPWAPTPTAKP